MCVCLNKCYISRFSNRHRHILYEITPMCTISLESEHKRRCGRRALIGWSVLWRKQRNAATEATRVVPVYDLVHARTVSAMVAFCSVPQCKSRKEPGISFHLYPKPSRLKKAWLIKLRMGKPAPKYALVCSKHFQEEDFVYPVYKALGKIDTDTSPYTAWTYLFICLL